MIYGNKGCLWGSKSFLFSSGSFSCCCWLKVKKYKLCVVLKSIFKHLCKRLKDETVRKRQREREGVKTREVLGEKMSNSMWTEGREGISNILQPGCQLRTKVRKPVRSARSKVLKRGKQQHKDSSEKENKVREESRKGDRNTTNYEVQRKVFQRSPLVWGLSAHRGKNTWTKGSFIGGGKRGKWDVGAWKEGEHCTEAFESCVSETLAPSQHSQPMCNILPPRCPADILHNQSPYGPTVAACEGLYLRYTQQRRPFSTNMASTPNKTNMAT